MTLASLFDGSGGFPLAGILAGITPLWASEIEPFPIRVTTKRLPFMKHYGDVSKINGAEVDPVDIITFGSPCQDLSVAGNRAGIENGSRSSLFFEAIRIIKEMRSATNGLYPTFVIWENVPGALSSGGGADFARVIEEIVNIKKSGVSIPRPARWSNAGEVLADGFSCAWRILNAQFWGVAQRRRRIFLIADFRGQRAGKILFERDGMHGDFTPSGEARKRPAGHSQDGIDPTGLGIGGDIAGTLDASYSRGCGKRSGKEREVVAQKTLAIDRAAYNQGQNAQYDISIQEELAQTLVAKGPGGVCAPMDNTQKTLKIRGGCAGGGKGALIQDNKSATLKTENDQTLFVPCVVDMGGGKSQCGVSRNLSPTLTTTHAGEPAVTTAVAVEGNGARPSHEGSGYSEDNVSFTLNATEQHGVAYSVENHPHDNRVCIRNDGTVQTLTERMGTGGCNVPMVANTVKQEYIVRRLTPTECARLQGFPDWWCADLDTPDPTEDDLVFWRKVFETHRKITGTSSKPKSDAQIVKWLKHPHSDSAEYKMWGNGVALPCVYYIMQAIADVVKESENE